MSKTQKITLDVPLGTGETKITEVNLIKPRAGHLRGLKLTDVIQMDVSAMITLVPRISTPSLTPIQMEDLDPADLMAISGQVAGFFTSKADLAAAGLAQ